MDECQIVTFENSLTAPFNAHPAASDVEDGPADIDASPQMLLEVVVERLRVNKGHFVRQLRQKSNELKNLGDVTVD